MLQFNDAVREREIITQCFSYLPNANQVEELVYKVKFVIAPEAVVSKDLPPSKSSKKVHQARFRIEYNEIGGRMWEFAGVDTNV